MSKKSVKIVIGITGSIAAYKSADIIRRLQDHGFLVSAIMTQEAQYFITPLTISSLLAEKAYLNFTEGEGDWPMQHIRLAQEADLLLIAPATANIIGKMACGLADDLLTATILATRAPILIAPAMNTEMYKNSIVEENCAKLKKRGMKFVEPKKGRLACGITGEGHIADVDDIVKAVMNCVK